MPPIFIFKYFWAIAILFGLVNTLIYKFRSRKYIKEKPELAEGYNRLIWGQAFWQNLPWLVMGVGIVSGHTTHVFDYFHPKDGNPYVLAFFVCVVLEWILLIYWIFFREGAEKLCKYQGLFNRPFNSPALIKVFTVIGIMGGIAGFTMMCLVSFPVPHFPK